MWSAEAIGSIISRASQNCTVSGWRANVMPFDIPFSLAGPRPAIAGTGLVALDVVIPNEPRSFPQLWAGGTCGNVLTALAYLGWDSYPIARLRDDAFSNYINQDLARWNVHLDY